MEANSLSTTFLTGALVPSPSLPTPIWLMLFRRNSCEILERGKGAFSREKCLLNYILVNEILVLTNSCVIICSDMKNVRSFAIFTLRMNAPWYPSWDTWRAECSVWFILLSKEAWINFDTAVKPPLQEETKLPSTYRSRLSYTRWLVIFYITFVNKARCFCLAQDLFVG